ncbi:meiotically up-regulated protein [Metarhizium acridum CQMa 102]|uniref:NAD(P)H-hydrate epimerase n=1 Tax=Metarhizium acridum (strain CQMa 102) TaxID=655827 RepID=E9DWP8_METAQ|nr:meiotically up-regulated protein [Metarhizium acridum CQMa 102]EFY91761.1 meiotically up-regulated protein [Metarhizium acridum CQMa 102]
MSNNHQGGDGLVAARHLFYYGYQPTIFYPKRSKNELYQRLAKQLEDLEVPFVDDFQSAVDSTDHIVDAVFGFNFSGDIREPFPKVIQTLEETKVPVTSVDAPSSWDIESGPPKSGVGSAFMPATLISLTAPKPLVKFFRGRHFVGGRRDILSRKLGTQPYAPCTFIVAGEYLHHLSQRVAGDQASWIGSCCEQCGLVTAVAGKDSDGKLAKLPQGQKNDMRDEEGLFRPDKTCAAAPALCTAGRATTSDPGRTGHGSERPEQKLRLFHDRLNRPGGA